MHLLIWSAHEGRIGENHKMRILYGVEGPRFWKHHVTYLHGQVRQPSQIFASEHDGWAKALGWTATGSAPCRTRPVGAPLEGGMESPMEALDSKDLWWPIHTTWLCDTMCHDLTYPVIQDFTVNGVAQKAGRGERKHKEALVEKIMGKCVPPCSTQKESKEVNRIWCHEGRSGT